MLQQIIICFADRLPRHKSGNGDNTTVVGYGPIEGESDNLGKSGSVVVDSIEVVVGAVVPHI